jgi:very-short-patch-repair endonuclease
LIAASLVWGPKAYASHRAAARLWKLVGFDEDILELTVPTTRRRLRSDVFIHRRPPIDARDRTLIDAIPVTGIARTLIDLAAVAPRDAVEEALDDALTRRLLTVEQIRRRLAPLGARRGTATMRALVDARDPRLGIPATVMETRFFRLLRGARLPLPVRQPRINDDTGNEVARVDFAYPDLKIAIEADSYRWHADPTALQHDREQTNALLTLDWIPLRFTWTDMTKHGTRVAEQVEQALIRRGKDAKDIEQALVLRGK